jgi:hypothetical protein
MKAKGSQIWPVGALLGKERVKKGFAMPSTKTRGDLNEAPRPQAGGFPAM